MKIVKIKVYYLWILDFLKSEWDKVSAQVLNEVES